MDKFLKREVIGITLSLQNKIEAYSIVNNRALEEICKFNQMFVKLESEINIVKHVNTLFIKRVVDKDRQYWKKLIFQEGKVWKL